jgi:N-acyl homoserine lactone hydrolase
VKGDQPVPSVDTVLRGMAITSNEGNFAPCGVYLVRSGDRTVVYDFGHVGRRMKLVNALGRRGLKPSDVDTVVVSHAHWDHLQNVDLFDRAEILVHAEELAYAGAPHCDDHATPSWSAALLAADRTRTVVDGEEIAPGVRVLHLPGHTPGSIGLAAETGAGVAVLSGDALASGPDALARECPNVFWDPAAADESIRRAADLADVVYPGHDRPFRVVDGDLQYLTDIRPMSIALGAIGPEDVTVARRVRSGRRNLVGRAAEIAAQSH